MKRVYALAMVLCLTLTVFCGCNNNQAPSDEPVDVIINSTTGNGSDATSASAATVTDSSGHVVTDPSGNPVTTTGNGKTPSNGQSVVTASPNHGKDGYYLNDLNAAGKASVVNNCYTKGYPVAKDTVKFNVMIKDYTDLSNYNSMKINDFLKEKMNVEIRWSLVTLNELKEKQTLAYTSGNMPDMFWGLAPSPMTSQWQYIKDGLVVQLDDYINKYAPNVKRMFSEEPAAKYSVTMQDGHIYSIPMYNAERDNFVYEGLYINKTWLNNLGLSMPTNTSQLMKVLTAFKNNDPNGNGKADEIPLCLHSQNMAGVLPACLYGPFGLACYGGFAGYSIDDSGKVQANFITQNYKTALTYYKTLYKKGLIDANWFSNTYATLKSKLNTGTVTVGAFVSGEPLGLMSEERLKNYTLVPAFRDKVASKATWAITNVENVWGEWFIVTKSCKYKEVAVRLADYFYSLEGTLTALKGPQGYNWDVKSDGSIYMKDDYYKGKYKNSSLTPGYPLPNYASAAYYKLVDMTASSLTSKTLKAEAQSKKDIVKTYASAAPKNVMPNLVQYTTDKAKGSEPQNSYLTEYVQKLTGEFISGSTDINAFWDNYVSVCKNLGAESSTKYQQKAYNRFVKAVKK